ncbi:MAG: hypothetical protein MPN21_02890 [Thermoanaerobaculia bacterium]|nr:hypothetical protein [Thermoanaerobaculia bacterium]
MQRHSPRPSFALLTVLAVLVLTVPPMFAQNGQESPEPRPALERIWWNKPALASELGLSPELRKQMDALLIAELEERGTPGVNRDLRQAIVDAIVAGDFELATKKSEELRTAVVELGKREIELKIEVAKLLGDAKRKALYEMRPRLFSESWLRLGVGSSRTRPGGDVPKRDQ